MLEALQSSLANVLILLLVSACGWWAARRGTFGEKERAAAAKIVTFTLPFYLFHSVVSKFSHEALIELLETAFVPFVIVGINTAISLLLIRFGLVRREVRGAFVASFTGSTVLFVGVPLTTALYGPEGIPYLLVYFFANLVFIWTAGLYAVKLDGVAARGGPRWPEARPRFARKPADAPFASVSRGAFRGGGSDSRTRRRCGHDPHDRSDHLASGAPFHRDGRPPRGARTLQTFAA